MEWNFHAWFILLSVGGLYLFPTIVDLLIEYFSRWTPSEEWSRLLDEETWERRRRYGIFGANLKFARRTTFAATFLLLWLGGGFTWLADRSLAWTANPDRATTLASLTVVLIAYTIWLFFRSLDVFWLEARFGFNRTSVRTFVFDQIKLLGLFVALSMAMAPVLHRLATSTESTTWNALGAFDMTLPWWANVLIAAISLTILVGFSPLILRLFLRTRPLEEGPLRERIDALAERCGFPSTRVLVVDGSRRTTRTNAFFLGIGRHKLVGLFDTLIADCSPEEIEAVVAHEIGHWRLGHLRQRILYLIVPSYAVAIVVFEHLKNNHELAAALGLPHLVAFASFLGFAVFYAVSLRLLFTAICILSRHHEYQADRYSALAMNTPKPLADGLRRIAQQNLCNPTPHPWRVFLNYTHPPIGARIAALEGGARSGGLPSHVEESLLAWREVAGGYA